MSLWHRINNTKEQNDQLASESSVNFPPSLSVWGTHCDCFALTENKRNFRTKISKETSTHWGFNFKKIDKVGSMKIHIMH